MTFLHSNSPSIRDLSPEEFDLVTGGDGEGGQDTVNCWVQGGIRYCEIKCDPE